MVLAYGGFSGRPPSRILSALPRPAAGIQATTAPQDQPITVKQHESSTQKTILPTERSLLAANPLPHDVMRESYDAMSAECHDITSNTLLHPFWCK